MLSIRTSKANDASDLKKDRSKASSGGEVGCRCGVEEGCKIQSIVHLGTRQMTSGRTAGGPRSLQVVWAVCAGSRWSAQSQPIST